MRGSTENRKAEDERDHAGGCGEEHSSAHLIRLTTRRSPTETRLSLADS
jgi:hypothetical protein